MTKSFFLIFLLSFSSLLFCQGFYLFSSSSSSSSSSTASDSISDSLSSASEAVSDAISDLDSKAFYLPHILELSDDGFDWQKDWWKYAIMLLSFLIALCLISYLVGTIFRILAALFCLCSAVAAGFYLDKLFCPWLPDLLPEEVFNYISSQLLCRIVAAASAYILAGFLLNILQKPLKKKKKNDD